MKNDKDSELGAYSCSVLIARCLSVRLFVLLVAGSAPASNADYDGRTFANSKGHAHIYTRTYHNANRYYTDFDLDTRTDKDETVHSHSLHSNNGDFYAGDPGSVLSLSLA